MDSRQSTSLPPSKNSAPHLLVGLDIGGTKTEAMVVDRRLQVQGRIVLPTDATHPDALVASTSQAIYRALALAQANPQQLSGIGVGVPGQVDRETGEVSMAVNLNLERYPLGAALTTEFQVPSYLENDVRVAALGAYRWLRQQQPVQNMAYLSIGTGISAGLILNGRLYRGSNGMAGEIGHIVVDPQGETCRCGLRGCLETVASGPAIAHRAAPLMSLPGAAPLTTATVYQAAATGDAGARQAVAQASTYLSRAIQWLIMAYDVEKVVLGGGVARAGDAFMEPILSAMSQMRAQSGLAAAMLTSAKIMGLPPDYSAGAWGAILLAQKDWRQDS